MTAAQKEKIYIFDTTLRDGEQVPEAKLTTPEKVTIACQLVRLGVDVIEAGFPISSPGDFNSVVEVANVAGEVTVCAVPRPRPKGNDAPAERPCEAKSP